MNGDFLETMLRASTERAREARSRQSLTKLRQRVADLPPPPALKIDRAGFDVIAEIKRRSPALGTLADPVDEPAKIHAKIAERATRYAQGGACAISVLTEPDRFDGCLTHLSAAAVAVKASGVPVMRKDFLVDPYQVFEARAAGAGGVLLIVRMLSNRQLDEMLDAATQTGMFVLLEAFSADDLARAGDYVERMPAPPLLGLNTRDLTTLQIDSGRLAQHAGDFAAGSMAVAESGVHDLADVERIVGLGYRIALIGTALMQAADPAGLLGAMIRTGRRASARDTPGQA